MLVSFPELILVYFLFTLFIPSAIVHSLSVFLSFSAWCMLFFFSSKHISCCDCWGSSVVDSQLSHRSVAFVSVDTCVVDLLVHFIYVKLHRLYFSCWISDAVS